MGHDPDEVVTVLVDLRGVPLAKVPVLRELIERLVRDGEQVSALQSSI